MKEGDACDLPTPSVPEEEYATVRRMLAGKRVAVVGLSGDPYRASYGVAAYLKAAGYDVIPVNPNEAEVMGLKSYPSLRSVPGPIDIVDVFRRPEHCPEVVRDAVAVGAKGVWLQSGVISEEAERLAREAGIDFVQDRCLKVEHMYRGR
jgi:predicted CoA-binding protein